MTPASAQPVEVQISTSDQKRGPARKLITQLVTELGDLGCPARVLNCMGLRAEESRARLKNYVHASLFARKPNRCVNSMLSQQVNQHLAVD
jgi:hypothetical protein